MSERVGIWWLTIRWFVKDCRGWVRYQSRWLRLGKCEYCSKRGPIKRGMLGQKMCNRCWLYFYLVKPHYERYYS